MSFTKRRLAIRTKQFGRGGSEFGLHHFRVAVLVGFSTDLSFFYGLDYVRVPACQRLRFVGFAEQTTAECRTWNGGDPVEANIIHTNCLYL